MCLSAATCPRSKAGRPFLLVESCRSAANSLLKEAHLRPAFGPRVWWYGLYGMYLVQ